MKLQTAPEGGFEITDFFNGIALKHEGVEVSVCCRGDGFEFSFDKGETWHHTSTIMKTLNDREIEFADWLHNEMDLGFVEPMVPAKPGGLWHISLTRFSGAEEDVVTTAELHKLFADERFKKMSEGKNA